MPHDGVVEHNFAIQYYLDEARTSSSTICVTLLDLSNAFGSVPLSLVLGSLERLGIGEDMLEILRDLMTNTSTTIVTTNGLTEELLVGQGVRQGCPLSGFLFNTATKSLLQAIKMKGWELGRTDRLRALLTLMTLP